jgi:hypothetical protein
VHVGLAGGITVSVWNIIWSEQSPSRHWSLPAKLCSVTSQKTVIFTIARISAHT